MNLATPANAKTRVQAGPTAARIRRSAAGSLPPRHGNRDVIARASMEPRRALGAPAPFVTLLSLQWGWWIGLCAPCALYRAYKWLALFAPTAALAFARRYSVRFFFLWLIDVCRCVLVLRTIRFRLGSIYSFLVCARYFSKFIELWLICCWICSIIVHEWESDFFEKFGYLIELFCSVDWC